jgi:hypothetical protein
MKSAFKGVEVHSYDVLRYVDCNVQPESATDKATRLLSLFKSGRSLKAILATDAGVYFLQADKITACDETGVQCQQFPQLLATRPVRVRAFYVFDGARCIRTRTPNMFIAKKGVLNLDYTARIECNCF